MSVMSGLPGPATKVAISRTYKGFLKINKKMKPCGRTMDTNMEIPDGDTRITKVYDMMLKLISNLGNAK